MTRRLLLRWVNLGDDFTYAASDNDGNDGTGDLDAVLARDFLGTTRPPDTPSLNVKPHPWHSLAPRQLALYRKASARRNLRRAPAVDFGECPNCRRTIITGVPTRTDCPWCGEDVPQ